MGREKRDKAVGKAPLSAHPWENRTGHIASLYCMNKQVLGSARFVHEAGAWAGLAGYVCRFSGRSDVTAPLRSLLYSGIGYLALISSTLAIQAE